MLVTLFVATLLALGWVALGDRTATTDRLVEVEGDVTRPGTYRVRTPDVAEAIAAAGGLTRAADVPSIEVPDGHRVRVHAGHLSLIHI